MKEKGFNSTSLRVLLICLLVIVIGIFIGGYYYAQDKLITLTKEVTQTSDELASKQNNQVQTGLSSDQARFKTAIDKSAGFFVPAGNYRDILAQDLNKYASDTSLELTDISPTQSTTPIGGPNTTGLQNVYIKVTVKNPVNFTNLIKFLKATETNIPRMRLTGINITHTSSDASSVSVEPLIMEAYTR